MIRCSISKLGGPLISILGLIFFANVANADYVVAQNRSNGDNNLAGNVRGANEHLIAFEYIATSTRTQVDRLDASMCYAVSQTPGEIISLGVYTRSFFSGAYFYQHVASSSIETAGNVALCASGATTGATTTTFVLDNKIQWVSGVRTYWVFQSNVPTSTIRWIANPTPFDNFLLYASTTDQNFPESPYSNINPSYVAFSGIIRGLGSEPTPFNIYNSSSTPVVCETFDVGCYFSSALSWAFTLPDNSFSQFETLKDDIKYHAPFGYFTSAYNAISQLSATGSPQFSLATSTPIMALVFTPIRAGLSWLILFAGLFWIYKRLTEIHI